MWTSHSTLSHTLLSAILPRRPTADPLLARLPDARYEYKEVVATTMEGGAICADLLVRGSNGKSINATYHPLHPRYLLEEIKLRTGTGFALAANKPGRTVQFYHAAELYESQVTTVKCSLHTVCSNAINMRTWWNKSRLGGNANNTNGNMLSVDVDCTICGRKGHLARYCAEGIGYIRLTFTLNHFHANTMKNVATPRHFPETEPAMLLLPMPAALPDDDLVDSLFNLP